jgi:spoIIIJ-associated protein
MPDIYELEADNLEDAIRQLITKAAGGDVDIHLRTRGWDPRRTGATTLRVEVEAPAERSSRDADADARDVPEDRPARQQRPAKQVADDRAPRNSDAGSDEPGPTTEELEEEADVAADFMEGLLDAMQLPGDISIKILDDAAIVEVVEGDAGSLIGRRGQTLESLQELARCSLQREFERRTRVRIDVEGYRERRLEKLLDKADEVVDEVLKDGGSVRLEPMDVFERKAVHDLVAGVEGVESRSVGREPGRRVVIEAAG